VRVFLGNHPGPINCPLLPVKNDEHCNWDRQTHAKGEELMSDFGRLVGRLGCCSYAAFIVLWFLSSPRMFMPPISLLTLGFIGGSAVATLWRLSSMKRLTPADKYLFAGIWFLCIAAFFGAAWHGGRRESEQRAALERAWREHLRLQGKEIVELDNATRRSRVREGIKGINEERRRFGFKPLDP